MLRKKKYKVFFSLITFNMLLLASFTVFANTNYQKNIEGNVQTIYNWQSSNSSNIRNSYLAASTRITWFQQPKSFISWKKEYHNFYDNHLLFKKCHDIAFSKKIILQKFFFANGSWLSDRYNGYRSLDTLVAGCGFQILTGPSYTIRMEAGPGINYNEYQNGENTTKAIGYAAVSYSYKLTKNANFLQGLSIFANNNTTFNSETGLNIDINEHFSLKVAYNVICNKEQPEASQNTNTRTSVSLIYKMQ
ncbi:Uncharacterized protein YdiY [secondary endosymbiont of Trabutina mannipara]|uniref:Uncharacterized protein YdiY n=1 Tax=secondary endosymbiont of Trabutina mannipara TaxID=1835721 RepID=A0A1C3L426_9ENTR|nr:DUF481 domain-containing protein [secondary endosymbiont of Trabutina mannipara]SBT82026.1 Uncharacterized protein YdiY [secondary endosymbiont of Trabutina mannipara]